LLVGQRAFGRAFGHNRPAALALVMTRERVAHHDVLAQPDEAGLHERLHRRGTDAAARQIRRGDAGRLGGEDLERLLLFGALG
jgi:hypothetical protein